MAAPDWLVQAYQTARRRLGLPVKPSKALVDWLRDSGDPRRATTLSLQGVRQAKPNNTQNDVWEKAQFSDRIEASLRGAGALLNVHLDAQDGPREITGSSEHSDRYIQTLVLGAVTNLTLSGLSVKALHVSSPGVKLSLARCNIGDLTVNQTRAEIRLVQSNVGALRVVQSGLGHYEMEGGSLLNVDCPTPGPGNPFVGTVSFKNVFLPRKRNVFILAGPQPYRNLRYHLRALENAQMANLIHSAELAVERADDPWFTKLVSYVYEGMSDFGSSALLPIVWLAALFIVSYLLILHTDGAVFASSAELVGWQTTLADPYSGRYARAAYLAVQSLANPIGIFGPKLLLVPRTPWLAMWLSVEGILGIILLALFIFAVRRRFKIQA